MYTRTKLHIPGSELQIGDLAKDEITGFEGIVTTHSRHLTGCDTIWLASQTEVHDGRSVDRCFDILRLELVQSNPMDVKGFPENVEPAG
ncbi:MAG: hypothetical protein V3W41_14600 [Planctomycetota bacterium]